MELSRLVGGGTPLVMNVALQSAATVLDGVFLVATEASTTALGATVTTTSITGAGDNALGVTQVSTAQASASPENTNHMGAYRFNIDTDGIPNTNAAGGGAWIPTCINTDALYYASFSTVTAVNAAANTGISATTGTSVTIVGLGNPGVPGPKNVGGWLMDGGNVALSSAGGTPTFNGQLRAVTASAASSILSLTTAMNVSTDSNLVFTNGPMGKGTILSDDATQRGTIGAGTVGALSQGYMIIDSYVKHDTAPMHPLRQWVDDGLDGLTGNVMYNELQCTSYYVNEGTA